MNLPVLVFGLVLVFCRVGACVMFMPGLSSLRISARARLLLGLAISILLAPLVPATHAEAALAGGPASQALAMGIEILVGTAIGLVARVFFMMLEMAAVAISNAMGLSLSFAPALDGDQSVPTVAGMIGLAAVVVFFVSGLHGEVLRALVDSYSVMPPLQTPDMRLMLVDLVDVTVAASLVCLQLAGPIFIVSILVNVAFGLLNRMTPQAPVFFISAPFVIAAGMLVLFSAEKSMIEIYTDALGRWLDRL